LRKQVRINLVGDSLFISVGLKNLDYLGKVIELELGIEKEMLPGLC
jgi:hypothetical protein